jgi:predicted permease
MREAGIRAGIRPKRAEPRARHFFIFYFFILFLGALFFGWLVSRLFFGKKPKKERGR